MAEITQRVLEQLIDCTEAGAPSIHQVHMMASEIMRMRGFGDMIPGPDEALKQKAAVLLKHMHDNDNIGAAYKRVGDVIKEKFGAETQVTLEAVLLFVAGESPSDDSTEWVSIPTALLAEMEAVINDSVGFGRSGGPLIHNNALLELRKFMESSNGTSDTLVKKQFLDGMKVAIRDINYGHVYPQSAREAILVKLNAIQPDLDDVDEGVERDD